MQILTCYKIVPEEQDIFVTQESTLSFERAEFKLGQYDLNAVEAGVRLVEELGGAVSSLTVGGEEVKNTKLQKGILSRGVAQNYAVCDPTLQGTDSNTTAKTLVKLIEKIDQWNLILCGEGSSDLYSQQVGIQLGEMLDVPTINAVSAIAIEEGKLVVERTLEKEIETLIVPLPAVLSVTADINITRVPSMKEILGAGKKPSTIWTGDDVTLPLDRAEETISIMAPGQAERKGLIVEGESDEHITAFLNLFRSEIV